MSKQHCRMLQCRMLLRQSRTLLRDCCPKRQHCRSNRQQSCLLLRQCCFDIVASVDRALCSNNGQTYTVKARLTLRETKERCIIGPLVGFCYDVLGVLTERQIARNCVRL